MVGAFWDQVLNSDMKVPGDRPLPDMTAELIAMLGSPDAHERDEVAFSVLACWIGSGAYDDLLVSLGDSVCTGLHSGLGEQGTDSVFRRSFSALVLTCCVERDNAAHLVPVDSVMSWAEQGLNWYTREADLRGYVDGKGWAHAIAHGADLLGALSLSRHLDTDQLGVLLNVVSERLLAPTSTVLVDGEDDRLAYAVLTLCHRNRVDAEWLEEWVAALAEEIAAVPVPPGEPVPPHVRNAWQFLRTLYVHLSLGSLGRSPSDPAAGVDFSTPPACRSDLLLALAQALPASAPR